MFRCARSRLTLEDLDDVSDTELEVEDDEQKGSGHSYRSFMKANLKKYGGDMKKCAEAYRKQKGGHNATVKGPAGKSKAKHTHVGDNPAKKPPSAEDVSDTEMELTDDEGEAPPKKKKPEPPKKKPEPPKKATRKKTVKV